MRQRIFLGFSISQIRIGAGLTFFFFGMHRNKELSFFPSSSESAFTHFFFFGFSSSHFSFVGTSFSFGADSFLSTSRISSASRKKTHLKKYKFYKLKRRHFPAQNSWVDICDKKWNVLSGQKMKRSIWTKMRVYAYF